MDLLEYQGKQLFARHGLEVSDGRAVTTVEDAVAAANEIGYPVVVKAQVLIGGRGKAGGVKLADDEAQAREPAPNILGLDIKGHIVRTLWIEHASDIATEYYASVLLDRSAKQPLVIFRVGGGGGGEARATARRRARGAEPRGGRRDRNQGRRRRRRDRGCGRCACRAVRGVAKGGRHARGDQPLDRDSGAQGEGPRRQGLARRQRSLPPSREPGTVRQRERRSDRAQGQGARCSVR